MRKRWLLAVGLALVLVIVGLVGCTQGSTVTGGIKGLDLGSQQQGIWVNGEGKVTVVPDVVTLRLGIEAQAASVGEAQTKANEAMNRVMTALTENGVAKKDIKTQYFNISKVTRWDEKNQQEVVIGYRVTNMVTAKIRDIDKAGSIIDAVARTGGDLTRVDSLSFSVDNPSAYYAEAREKAMAEAKAKAEQLAGLAGVKLGKPIYIAEGISYPVPRQEYTYVKAAAAEAPTPISPGETEITLSVQVVYAIK